MQNHENFDGLATKLDFSIILATFPIKFFIFLCKFLSYENVLISSRINRI